VVPLVETHDASGQLRMKLNFGLIHKVIKYVEDRIFRMLYENDWKAESVSAVDLEPARQHHSMNDPSAGPVEMSEFGRRRTVNGIWDDLFSGVRYVKLEAFSNH